MVGARALEGPVRSVPRKGHPRLQTALGSGPCPVQSPPSLCKRESDSRATGAEGPWCRWCTDLRTPAALGPLKIIASTGLGDVVGLGLHGLRMKGGLRPEPSEPSEEASGVSAAVSGGRPLGWGGRSGHETGETPRAGDRGRCGFFPSDQNRKVDGGGQEGDPEGKVDLT